MIQRHKIWPGNPTILPKIIATFFLFFLPFALAAQETWDLNRCIQIGLECNFAVKVARNEQQAAENNYSRGNAGFLPSVSTSGRLGGTLATTTQNLTDGSENVSTNVNNTAGSASIDLDMTLFRGFDVQTTYQKLNELRQVGLLNTQMSMENLVSDIASEYYYLVEQINFYSNMAYAVSLSRERVRIDEQRYQLGASSKLELLQSIVYLNADSSRLTKQVEVLRTSEIRLKKLMAFENIDERIALLDSTILFNPNLVYNELLASTLDYNTGLLIAAKNQQISELDYKIIASRAYPYLDLYSGYNLSTNNYGSGPIDNQHARSMNYGITLGMDVFDGFNRRREKANAIIQTENRTYQYREIEQEIKADLLTIFYAYQNNLSLINLEEQNLEVARENLDIALERYKLGALSGLELREVQKSLLDAEERLITVKFQTKLAEISLLQIAGKIMDYAG